MIHRFHYNDNFYYVATDDKKKIIQIIEVEGEIPLLIANTKHNNGSLWVLHTYRLDEYEIAPSKFYEEENEDGVTKVWHWCDENSEVRVRLLVFNSNKPEDNPAQVILTTPTSLFVFMTDFKDWVYSECYGNPILEMEQFCREWLKRTYPEEGE